MTNGQSVRMIKCSKSEYDSLAVKDDAALYYCTDKKMIFLGSILIANANEWSSLEEYSPVDPVDDGYYPPVSMRNSKYPLTRKMTLSEDSDDSYEIELSYVEGALNVSDEHSVKLQKGMTYLFEPDLCTMKLVNKTGSEVSVASTKQILTTSPASSYIDFRYFGYPETDYTVLLRDKSYDSIPVTIVSDENDTLYRARLYDYDSQGDALVNGAIIDRTKDTSVSYGVDLFSDRKLDGIQILYKDAQGKNIISSAPSQINAATTPGVSSSIYSGYTFKYLDIPIECVQIVLIPHIVDADGSDWD